MYYVGELVYGPSGKKGGPIGVVSETFDDGTARILAKGSFTVSTAGSDLMEFISDVSKETR